MEKPEGANKHTMPYIHFTRSKYMTLSILYESHYICNTFGAVNIDKLALLTKQGLRQDSEAGTINNDTIGT